MTAKRRKKSAWERSRLGSSFHATIELERKIVERAHKKGISLEEAEKEILEKLKKKIQK